VGRGFQVRAKDYTCKKEKIKMENFASPLVSSSKIPHAY
jgi:hypothetical protein